MIDNYAEKYYSLTLYQYGANNPILFIDINGDSLNISGTESAINSFNNENEQAMDGMYSTNVDATGNTELLPLPSTGAMSKEASEFKSKLSEVINDKKTTSMNVVENSENVMIGDVKTKTVDIGDIKCIGNNDVLKKGGMLIHEISEQHTLQTKLDGIPNGIMDMNTKIGQAHNMAIQVENSVNGSTRGSMSNTDLVGKGTGSYIINYSKNTTKTTVVIDYVRKNPTNVLIME